MVYRWLCSEWHRFAADLGLPDYLVATNADRGDQAQNDFRRFGLRLHRGTVIDPLPDDCSYSEVEIDAKDVDNLYVIPSDDWYLDSGRTSRLGDVSAHLGAGQYTMRPNGRTPIGHANRVASCRDYVTANGVGDDRLILVSTAEAPPFTIIDGTHRAAMYLMDSQLHPWQAILVSSPRMGSYKWHVGSDHMEQLSTSYSCMVTLGIIG